MSNQEREGIERDLYYDIGYRFAEEQTTSDKSYSLQFSMVRYMFILTLVLHFTTSLSLLLTIGTFVGYYLMRSYSDRGGDVIFELIGMTAIFFGFTVDHFLNGIVIVPGEMFTSRIGVFVWIFEITWVILFFIQLLIIQQPLSKDIKPDSTVHPYNPIVKEEFETLKNRLKGTSYQVSESTAAIHVEELRDDFTSIVSFLLGLGIFILFLDSIMWGVVSALAVGQNVEENYFVSGMAMILGLLLLVFSGQIFGSEEEPNLD